MKIKVCGMKYTDNIAQVAALQPDYLGFIFWEPSPRSFSGPIPPLPPEISKVGVFVDASLTTIVDRVREYRLDLIQLHGRETPDFCTSLREELDAVTPPEQGSTRTTRIIKAMAVGSSFAFSDLYPYRKAVDYFLFDSKGPLPGGNGFGFNWELLEDYDLDIPFFLSGGIGLQEVENIRRFLKTSVAQQCHAIDVNSAFEQKPGLKDTALLQQFIEKIKL
jgi:phosphoribosylanthranilate isomerase